jgi:anti-sigma regulatory factor (Ser/Thr protein kinase)
MEQMQRSGATTAAVCVPTQPRSVPSPAGNAEQTLKQVLGQTLEQTLEQRDANLLDLLGNPSVDEVQLTSHSESASLARQLTLAVIRLWALPQLGETCELLVSELVGNAVRHAGARTFGLRMLRSRSRIRVEVRDPSRGLPCLLPVGELDISGRGLFLIDKLSDRWGVDLLARGKTIWFELRVVA